MTVNVAAPQSAPIRETVVPAPAGAARHVPRLRWGIGVLLGCGVLVNYFDRINLSVAAPQLKHAFTLTDGQLGWLFSGFFWSYALMQIPTGMILDRFGVTKTNRCSTLIWSMISASTAFMSGFAGIFGARILLGAAEAPGFPASAKATGYWFPRQERSLATSIFDAGAKFSNVIGVPIVALVVVNFGWRFGFVVTASLSFLYFLMFFFFYRDPSKHPRLSSEEREYIRAGGAAVEGPAASGGMVMLGHLLRNRKLWGLTIGFAAYGYSFYLFLTWLPNYLVQTMHMSILKSAGFAAVPWACATVADLVVGGWLIDHLITKGYDDTRVRKTVLVSGMLLGLAVFGATLTADPVWAIVWISIALSGLAAAAPVGWSIPSLIAPKGATGTISGIMNFLNNMMGAVAPIATGYIVGATHSFTDAFLVAGIVLIIGILSYVFLLGKLTPIPDPRN
ncbi:MFS transporter (plasmid) [Lichenicola cladoniae]|uniref:MFS transporter n=1 Tax=Lichenicola cladoniae TaxID=1484109 RepID=A0A6M8HZ51_9PROT|nr:MFS transporter [Lichenicola cladoniae]NPD66762.1 MFS transporter [Acetobacteraceae bacterium]QKE93536.1 MFS transporter [Lichenicola cladoniae]